MKLILTLALFWLSSLTYSQSRLEPIEELNASESKINVVMLSADWCNICRVNETKIDRRKYLRTFDSEQVRFFKLDEKHAEPVVFDNRVYAFQQTGLNEGVHELITYFFGEEPPSYPTFLFIDFHNQIVESWSGSISESEMESVLNGILNQVEEPDSDNSN